MKLQLPEGLEDEMQLMLLDKASETLSDLKNPGVANTNSSDRKKTQRSCESVVAFFPALVYHLVGNSFEHT